MLWSPSTIRRKMNSKAALEAVAVLLLTVSLAPPGCQKAPEPKRAAHPVAPERVSRADVGTALPKLLDLGAGKCIPCKKMAPILEELKQEYAGSLEVLFIDVWQDSSAGEKYGIESIPTQIFYDASGKERFRHEGFFSKEDILAKWRELGVELQKSPSDPSPKT